MNKKYLFLAAASLAAASLMAGCGSSSDNTSAKEEEKTTLIVGTEPTFPPFEFTEGDKYVGFDLDLVQAIGDKIGVKMEIKSMGFDALIPALQSGQIDIIAAGMDSTPERSKQVSFTDPYLRNGYTVVVRKDNTTIHGFDDLQGLVVGAQVGSKPVDIATQYGATVKQYDANSQGWMELNAGTCDAVVIDRAVAQYYMTQGGNESLKLVGEPILPPTGMAMAVSKDNPELLKKVNQALTDMKEDGTFAAIYKKWFGTEPPADRMPGHEE